MTVSCRWKLLAWEVYTVGP